ncbi:transglycosylase domain-containing protein [Bacillus sp. Marseille-P3800]|uniref:transglycosylase domain-containing protein n=1 Tax=Bacillus sp. Marseille-P3800 TaxID=2014782 RepID=UPI00159BAEDF|nr:transglycosylase domain-containing protein [Bacillus sp. Marseille-P3800]
MKTFFGWFFIGLFALSSVFLFRSTSAEVGSVQTIGQVVGTHIDDEILYLSSNSSIVASNGQIVAEMASEGGVNRNYLPYEHMPEFALQSFVATEDRRFFQHPGFDASGIARAVITNVSSGEIDQGASTITQQMVRNIFLDHSQTYERKVSEILYAHELEQRYSKEEILELYLNSIYFGNHAYGIEAASQLYFSENAEQLSLAQIAFLTAIPNNPTIYDPFNAIDNTNKRKEWVLLKMKEEQFISDEEYEEAKAETIELRRSNLRNLYPDYTDYVEKELVALIQAVDGLGEEEAKDRRADLLKQGIKIETALEPDRQTTLKESFYHELPSDVEGAGMVIRNDDQSIVAMSHGRDYEKGNFMLALDSYRSHGSAFKPLIDFAPYFEETHDSIDKVVNGNPRENCTEQEKTNRSLGCISNYNDVKPGNVTLREAFKHSYNIPAQYLLDSIGIQTGISYLEPFQFKQLNAEERDISIALGTVDVSVYEMVQAYQTFAHDGAFTPAKAIKGVYDEHNDIIYEWPRQEPQQIWSNETNDKLRTLMSEVVQSGTGRDITLATNGYVGGKTGTSNEYRDLTFSGLTDAYTASVWVGRDRGHVEDLSPNRPAMKIWEAAVR